MSQITSPSNRQLLYQSDPTCFDFEATIRQKISLPQGQFGIILDHTFFYPTGGGQEHDTGTLGDARVLDVYKTDSTPVQLIHVVDHDLPAGDVRAKIDADRRLRHMQHHTAQHLLTHCFSHLVNAETVSANINGASPSTLDLTTQEIDKSLLHQVENLANTIIYQNRDVKAYFVTAEQLKSLPLRKKPAVEEDIRIIEIDGLDYSACGGTHVAQTGSIGLVKITRTERVNDKLRIHFVAGWQAYELFREYFDSFSQLAIQMSATPFEIPIIFQRTIEQLSSAQKDIQSLRIQQTKWEAGDLLQKGQRIGLIKFVTASYNGRSMQELRYLADELRQNPQTVAVITNLDGQKLSVIVSCAKDCATSAQTLLRHLLVPVSGRGGGDRTLAQGGGSASPEHIPAILALAEEMLVQQSL